MATKNDLTYLTEGLFTSFFPCTPDGEQVWRAIAAHSNGSGKVFTVHLASTLRQLRAAGFTVSKENSLRDSILDDELFSELFE